MSEVSVIVPVYNSARYLRECVDSLLGQDFREAELIFVDDGSTDDSYNILQEYAEVNSNMRVYQKENEGKGAASARNLGLEKASGAYVQFVDSDDFFEKNMISSMYQKAKLTDADIVICGADRFDEKEQRFRSRLASMRFDLAPDKECFSWRDVPDHLYQIADTVTWNKLYKRSLLDRYNLRYEAIPISDDQYVPALGLAFAERLAVVDEDFVHYRSFTGNSQVDTYAKHPTSAYVAAYSIIGRLKEAGLYDILKRSYLGTSVRLLRDYYDKMNSYELFVKQHEVYLSEVLPRFEAVDLPAGYFWDKKLDHWYQMILHNSPGEILFQVARAYSDDTTRILREGI